MVWHHDASKTPPATTAIFDPPKRVTNPMVHASEMFATGAFAIFVVLVYFAAALVLIRRFLALPRSPISRPGRAILGLAALGTLAVLYGRLVEPRWIEVTETRVTTSRLPAGHRGVRIVLLSDLHSDSAAHAEKRLPAIVASLEPDLIVFTGDAANTPEGVPVFRRCLSQIATIAPTFAVKGNWDAWFFQHLDRFGGTGAIELDGTAADVVVDGVTLHLVGAGFENVETLGAALESLPADGPAIVLYHCPYPDIVPTRLAPRIDLFLAGHVHGGQVALPFYGALVTFSKFGKRFERGLYPDADGFGFPLYVSRGIGTEGGYAPRVRFCARPEVALIELVPAAR